MFKMVSYLLLFIEFEEVFSFLDRDNDGQIHVQELLSALKSLGQDHLKHEVKDMIHDLDPTGYYGMKSSGFRFTLRGIETPIERTLS